MIKQMDQGGAKCDESNAMEGSGSGSGSGSRLSSSSRRRRERVMRWRVSKSSGWKRVERGEGCGI